MGHFGTICLLVVHLRVSALLTNQLTVKGHLWMIGAMPCWWILNPGRRFIVLHMESMEWSKGAAPCWQTDYKMTECVLHIESDWSLVVFQSAIVVSTHFHLTVSVFCSLLWSLILHWLLESHQNKREPKKKSSHVERRNRRCKRKDQETRNQRRWNRRKTTKRGNDKKTNKWKYKGTQQKEDARWRREEDELWNLWLSVLKELIILTIMSFSHVAFLELIKSYISNSNVRVGARVMRSGAQSHQTWRAMASGRSLSRAVAWNDMNWQTQSMQIRCVRHCSKISSNI